MIWEYPYFWKYPCLCLRFLFHFSLEFKGGECGSDLSQLGQLSCTAHVAFELSHRFVGVSWKISKRYELQQSVAVTRWCHGNFASKQSNMFRKDNDPDMPSNNFPKNMTFQVCEDALLVGYVSSSPYFERWCYTWLKWLFVFSKSVVLHPSLPIFFHAWQASRCVPESDANASWFLNTDSVETSSWD